MKNMVFRHVLYGKTKINSAKEFADYANQICAIDSLYLSAADIPDEPATVETAPSIPGTLKVHHVVRSIDDQSIMTNKFYYSQDEQPFSTKKYKQSCGHKTSSVGENTCTFCNKVYKRDEDWLQCPICKLWFHEECFF